MNGTSEFLYFFIAIIIIIIIVCYSALAIFLNRFNKKVTGNPTVMAWIPFANAYLLGKLTFNKDAGYGLVALFVLSGTLRLTFDKTTIVLSLPNVLQVILGAVFAGAFVVILIFGVKKYEKIQITHSKKNKKPLSHAEEVAKANDEFFNE